MSASKMATVEEARRKALQAAVASLCVEVGFVSVDRDAFQALSQLMQACKRYVRYVQVLHL